jgi:6-phosphogluconolactonase
MKLKFLVGCYTNETNQNGLHLFTFDEMTKQIELIGTHAISNASFATSSPSLPILYVVNENHTESDSVSAVSFDRKSNTFKTINTVDVGADPCFITVDLSGKFVFSANYSDGTLSCLPVNADGSLGDVVQVIKNEVDPLDDAHPNSHLHAVVFSPDEKFLLATNLGQDTITVYPYQPSQADQPLNQQAQQVYRFPAGTGPRHLLFDQNGRYVYVVGELDGSLHVLEWQNNKLLFVESHPLMPSDFNGKNSAADLHFDPTGRFLYVSNRGDANQLISFKVDATTGHVLFNNSVSSGGNGPRNFEFTKDGRFVLAANQYSNNLVVFESDEASGILTEIEAKFELNSPVFVQLL